MKPRLLGARAIATIGTVADSSSCVPQGFTGFAARRASVDELAYSICTLWAEAIRS